MNAQAGPPDLEPAVARILRREQAVIVSEPSLLRDPARFAVTVAAVAAIVTSLLPWLVPHGMPTESTQSGWSGYGDGLLLALAAAGILVLILHRPAAESTTLALRVAPLLLGLAGPIVAFGAYQAAERQLVTWTRQAGSGTIEPWLYACIGATVAWSVGGFWFGARGVRSIGPHESAPGAAGRRRVFEVAGALVGGGAGLLAVGTLGPALPVPILAGVGIFGAALGRGLAMWMAIRPAGRDTESRRRP